MVHQKNWKTLLNGHQQGQKLSSWMPMEETHITKAEMGFDNDGKIVALRVKTFANLGAYLSTFGSCISTYLHGTLLQGLYTTPKINVDVTAVFTHTTGRRCLSRSRKTGSNLFIERLVDLAALEMNVDPAELRFKISLHSF